MPYPPIMGVMHEPATPQRDALRFCKAFFEILDPREAQRRLVEIGAYPVGGPATEPASDDPVWLWWLADDDSGPLAGTPFLVRMFRDRMVLEGPSAWAVGLGWRLIADTLEGAAVPRVAAGDDLARFLPQARKRSHDRPETLSPEQERRVLREFYDAFAERWIRTPHPRLGGRTPLEAVHDSGLRDTLDNVLESLSAVEEARRERGQPCFSMERIRMALRS